MGGSLRKVCLCGGGGGPILEQTIAVTCNEKTLIFEKELSDIDFERVKNALMYIKNNVIDSDENMYVTFESLIDASNTVTSSNNITLRKANVKPCEYDIM